MVVKMKLHFTYAHLSDELYKLPNFNNICISANILIMHFLSELAFIYFGRVDSHKYRYGEMRQSCLLTDCVI